MPYDFMPSTPCWHKQGKNIRKIYVDVNLASSDPPHGYLQEGGHKELITMGINSYISKENGGLVFQTSVKGLQSQHSRKVTE